MRHVRLTPLRCFPILWYNMNWKNELLLRPCRKLKAIPHKSPRESDERFFVRKRCKTAGILCVFQGFTNEFLAEKIRQNPQTHLCGVAWIMGPFVKENRDAKPRLADRSRSTNRGFKLCKYWLFRIIPYFPFYMAFHGISDPECRKSEVQTTSRDYPKLCVNQDHGVK